MDLENKNNLYNQISDLLKKAQNQVRQQVNSLMVITYWNVGKIIFEDELKGKRAEYGKEVLKELSDKLTADFGKGFDYRNLQYMKKFYELFQNMNSVSSQLSWTHYRHLLKVEDERARIWYMNETAKENWSTRALERQINSFYYERLLASQNKNNVIEEAKEKTEILLPQDIFKKTLMFLEFLQLKNRTEYTEKELETALIDNLQEFLLELGSGFSFVARQKHFDLDGEHFYIDLVFYNYKLKCFVLIDLKKGKLTHQDVGQMDMYVRIFEDKVKASDDNPTIGLILCSEKNEAVAKYSVLAENKQLFASKYKLLLPTEEQLERELLKEINLLED